MTFLFSTILSYYWRLRLWIIVAPYCNERTIIVECLAREVGDPRKLQRLRSSCQLGSQHSADNTGTIPERVANSVRHHQNHCGRIDLALKFWDCCGDTGQRLYRQRECFVISGFSFPAKKPLKFVIYERPQGRITYASSRYFRDRRRYRLNESDSQCSGV